MRNIVRLLVVFSSVTMFALLLWLGVSYKGQSSRADSLRKEVDRLRQSTSIGQAISGRRLQMACGGEMDLDTAGRDLLLLFFSPNCPACQSQADSWPAAAAESARRGVRFLGVASTRDSLDSFIAKHALEFPIAIDADGALAQDCGVNSVPQRVLLNRQQEVALRSPAIAMLEAKVGSTVDSWATLSRTTRDQLLLVLAREFLPEVEAVTEMVLVHGSDPVFVMEGNDRVQAIARVIRSVVPTSTCSDLECLVFLDTDANPLGALPLRGMSEAGILVDQGVIRRWLLPRQVSGTPPAPLESAFRAGVDRLREEMGSPPLVTGLDAGGEWVSQIGR